MEPYTELYLHDYYYNLLIIIPLVVGVCVSLPALIWAFYFFYNLHKHGGQISDFVILLIINDLAELFLSVIIVSYATHSLVRSSDTKTLKQLTEEQYITSAWSELFENRMTVLSDLFTTFRIGGLCLHQLVALKSIISLKSQLCSGHDFSPLCSTISCIILWLLAFVCQFVHGGLYLFIFLSCCILAITCLLTCKASPGPDHIKPGSAVLIVSTLTLITFCVIAGFVLAFQSHFAPLITLRVISDPLLCVLVCKQQLRVHKLQTRTMMNTDQRSV